MKLLAMTQEGKLNEQITLWPQNVYCHCANGRNCSGL